MDLKDIQELIKFVAKSGATEVDLEIDNVKISIKSPPKKRRGAVDENPIFIQHETATPQEQVAPIADILGLNTTDTTGVESGPENFWAVWGVAFFLSLIFIAGILVPLIWPDRSEESKLAKLLPEGTSATGRPPLAPKKPAGQGGKATLLKRPVLKW